MKNKKSLYILLPLVIAIWGIIFWRIFSYQSKDTSSLNVHIKQEIVSLTDTSKYILVANYPDPFLRHINVNNKTSNNPAKQNNIKNIKLSSLKTSQAPPQIIYHGFISYNNSNTGLLEYNGNRYLIKEKEDFNNFKIISIKEDSIRIFFNDRIYAYAKN